MTTIVDERFPEACPRIVPRPPEAIGPDINDQIEHPSTVFGIECYIRNNCARRARALELPVRRRRQAPRTTTVTSHLQFVEFNLQASLCRGHARATVGAASSPRRRPLTPDLCAEIEPRTTSVANLRRSGGYDRSRSMVGSGGRIYCPSPCTSSAANCSAVTGLLCKNPCD